MTDIIPIAPLGLVTLLFFIILAIPWWINNVVLRILGCISIGVVLYFFNFPDISEYRNHFDILSVTRMAEFNSARSSWNFEYGYDVVVFISSYILPFEVFYVTTIATTLLCYYLFFRSYSEKNAVLSFIFLNSFFLYYISFTLRTTIASALIACALVLLKNNKKYLPAIAIATTSFVHTVALPFASILLIMNCKIFSKAKLVLIFLFISAFIGLTLIYIRTIKIYISQVEFIAFKLNSYEEFSGVKFNFLLLAWVVIGVIIVASKKREQLSEDLWIYFSISFVFVILSFNAFFQGRAMWAASFVFAHLIAAIFSIFIVRRQTILLSYLVASLGVFQC
jgi:hypothetical protein